MSIEPCPSSPNCVSTADDPDDAVHYMAPVSYRVEASEAITAIKTAVTNAGGVVTKTSTVRVDATFRTRLLRFTDDVAFVLDDEAKLLHFRSASRVGYSDLGTNRKRLKQLIPAIRSHIS